MLKISLEHLQEDEVQLILSVLERDAKIQKQEDARRRRLQNSVRGERIPEKRLSVKIRTGEWLSEMTAPNRALKKRGTEIVRASIRRKVSTKGEAPDNRIINLNKKETGETQESIENDHEDHKSAVNKPTAIVTPTNKVPVRRTSIRKKKNSTTQEKPIKEVKFDTEKTEKYIYEQANVEVGSQVSLVADTDVKNVPTIVIDDGSGQEPKAKEESIVIDETKHDTEKKETDPSSYDSEVYSTGATFESYHNSIGKDMQSDEKLEEEQTISDTHGSPKSEKPRSDEPPSGKKKIRVVKRKGSSRRKPGPKITDDSSRNTLFNMPTDDKPTEVETTTIDDKTAEKISEDIITAVVEDKGDSTEVTVDIAPIHTTLGANTVDSADTFTEEVTQDHHVKELVEETVKPFLKMKEEDDIANALVADIISHEIEDISMDKIENTEVIVEQSEEKEISSTQVEKNVTNEVEEAKQAEKGKDGNEEIKTVTIIESVQNTAQPEQPIIPDVTNEMENKKDENESIAGIDLDVGDLLSSMSAKYDSMMSSTTQDTSANDTSTSEKQQESSVEAITTEEPATVKSEEEKIYVDNIPRTEEKDQEKSDPFIMESITLEDKDAEPIIESVEITKDEETKPEKPKKKVVKKIIKKKKPAEGEDQESPKSEPTGRDIEEESESPKNLSKLTRSKTVRKKVVRRAPPPAQ